MSRYFELRQRVARERDPLPEVHRTGAAHVWPALDDVTAAELNKVVERLYLAASENRKQLVVFVGAEEGAGCSWICAHSAKMLAAKTTALVCVVDADPRRHSQFGYFGVQTSAANNGNGAHEQSYWYENLCLFATGTRDGASPLHAEEVVTSVAQLRSKFDYILVDAPVANASNDALSLGKIADGVVLVIGANKTRRELALRVKQEFEAAGVQVVGAVLNNRTFPVPDFIYRRL
jgi:protein-tyrosine kinase